MCGEDGKAENNCVFAGGMFQMLVLPIPDLEHDENEAYNVQVEGFTFDEPAGPTSVLIGMKGEITFKNCVFRVRRQYVTKMTMAKLSSFQC